MTLTPTPLAFATLLCLALATTASRADSFTSSASSAGSASSGSVSDSIEASSDSSSDDDEVAEGDYRIIDIAPVAERPGVLRLKLQAAGPEGRTREVRLRVPQQVLAQGRLVRGDVVTVSHRPYGLEFARADTREAFFLVLADDWQRELASHPVTL